MEYAEVVGQKRFHLKVTKNPENRTQKASIDIDKSAKCGIKRRECICAQHVWRFCLDISKLKGFSCDRPPKGVHRREEAARPWQLGRDGVHVADQQRQSYFGGPEAQALLAERPI